MIPTYQSGIAHGTIVRACDAASFRVSEAVFPPDAAIDWHRHAYPQFCLVLSGAYVESTTEGERLCEPSQLTFHPAHSAHRNLISRAGAVDLCVEVRAPGLDRLARTGRLAEQPLTFRHGDIVDCAQRLRRELQRPDEFSMLAVEGLALELLAAAARQACRPAHAPPDWLESVDRWIDAHLADRLSPTDLAAVAGVHPSHVARVFRRHRGGSIGESVRRRRLERARSELAESNRPIAEVAVAAGFYDQAHLTSCFRRAFGVTPYAFRKSCRAR